MYFQSCLATMSGALISKVTKQWRRGLVCPSLMRKSSRRSSFSLNSLDSLAKDALAAFTTLRSDPIKSTSRTYPLSSTEILRPIKACGFKPSVWTALDNDWDLLGLDLTSLRKGQRLGFLLDLLLPACL